ncbi:hypothetical protein [Streptomyces sp. NPDC091268]
MTVAARRRAGEVRPASKGWAAEARARLTAAANTAVRKVTEAQV